MRNLIPSIISRQPLNVQSTGFEPDIIREFFGGATGNLIKRSMVCFSDRHFITGGSSFPEKLFILNHHQDCLGHLFVGRCKLAKQSNARLNKMKN